MKRLKEEVASEDPRRAEAAQLLAEIAPLAESNVQKARVRRAIESKGGNRVRSRTAIIVAALLGSTGAAAAALGLAQVLEETQHEGPPPKAPSLRGVEGTRGVPRSGTTQPGPSPSANEKAAGPSLLEPSSAPDEPVETPRAAGADTPPAKNSAATPAAPKERTTTQEKAAMPQLSEARLVQEAVAALRTSGDTEKASALLAEYRKHSSSGHLDEEALALSIEVALLKKSPDAARHARTYLAKYPGGKFRPLAERALHSK